MSQVAALMVPLPGMVADGRSIVAEGDAVSGQAADGGQFGDIFEGFGGKSSEGDSIAQAMPAAKGDKAGGKAGATGPGSAANGLHRLLASGRFGSPAAAEGAAPAPPTLAADVTATSGMDAAGDPLAGDDLKADTPAQADPPVAVMAAMPAPAFPAVPPAEMPVKAPKPVVAPREETVPARTSGKGASGIVVVSPEAEDGSAASPPIRVPVTVESLETHFAPVEAVSAAVAEAATSGALPAKPVADRNGRPAPAAVPTKAETVAVEDPSLTDDGGASVDPTAPSMPQRPERAEPRQPAASVSDIGDRRVPTKADGAAPPAGAAMSLPPATLQKLGDAIVAGASDMETAPGVPVADASPASSRAVVKVLTVRLDPPEYGSLAVRLTLQDGALSVQIRAERETTAAALDHDREKLAEHLKASGYGTDATMIDTRRDMAVMRSDGAAGANAGSSGNGAAGSGGTSTGGGLARRDSGADGGGGGQGFARERQEGRNGAAVPDTGAHGLYV